MDMPKDLPSLMHAENSETNAEFDKRTKSALAGLKQGMKVSRRFALGKMPNELRGVENRRGRYRKTFEAAVLDKYGSISLVRAAQIAEGTLWASQIALIDWCLRNKLDELSARDLTNMAGRQAYAMRQVKNIVQELLGDERSSKGLLEQLQAQFESQQGKTQGASQ